MKRTAAAALLALASASAGAQAAGDAPTEEEVELFGGFYHGSLATFFASLGEELLMLPLEQFAALDQERRRNACTAIVDYTTYRSFVSKASMAARGRETTLDLMRRAKASGGFLFKDVQRRLRQISDKATHCLESGTTPIDDIGFTDGYTDARTEFRLRDMYRAQVPFTRRVWESVPRGQERKDLEVVIRSMERKYLLDIEIGPDG